MKHKIKKRLTAAALLSAILLLLYLCIALYYKNRFLFGSHINGISYSGKTVEQVEQDIEEKISSYSLTIQGRNGVTAIIDAPSIGYHYVKDGQIRVLKEEQNSFLWPLSFFGQTDLSMEVTTAYDKKLFAKVFAALPFFSPEHNIAPENASIFYSVTKGYQIEPEKENSKIKEARLKKLILRCLSQGLTTLVLEDHNCYEEPVYRADSPELKNALETAKAYTSLTITYEFGSRSEVLDQNTLHGWITIDDSFQVTINTDKIKEYVSYLNYHYTTFGISRQFTKQNGKSITIRGGDYGWWINRSAEEQELLSIIKKGKDITREPVYYQRAASREPDDIGSSYIEVNLKKQKLWVFIDGKPELSSDIVTGNLSRNYDTPTGVYSITYKERNATLTGENYNTPVSYWMPFNGNIGFHDATWRNEFGKDIYKKSGSHGCVNMPPKKAAKMYEMITKGMPVIVY